MNKFTKNKKTGNWDVIGENLSDGETVVVTKANGETSTVTLGRVSRPFVAKFGPHKGRKVSIATVEKTGSKSKYTPLERYRMGDRFAGTRYEGQFCGFPCPVTGRKCCPENGPCHDCL